MFSISKWFSILNRASNLRFKAENLKSDSADSDLDRYGCLWWLVNGFLFLNNGWLMVIGCKIRFVYGKLLFALTWCGGA